MKPLLSLAALLITASGHATTLTGVSAGVTPYACTKHGAEYLLAFDPQPKRWAWGTFGGRPKSGESARQTALREFYEETNCAYSREEMAAMEMRGPSRSGKFYTYVAEVPYIPPETIGTARKCNDVERLLWVWVPHATLISALKSNETKPQLNMAPPKPRISIWNGSARSMRNALAEGYLTEHDPCLEVEESQTDSGNGAEAKAEKAAPKAHTKTDVKADVKTSAKASAAGS